MREAHSLMEEMHSLRVEFPVWWWSSQSDAGGTQSDGVHSLMGAVHSLVVEFTVRPGRHPLNRE